LGPTDETLVSVDLVGLKKRDAPVTGLLRRNGTHDVGVVVVFRSEGNGGEGAGDLRGGECSGHGEDDKAGKSDGRHNVKGRLRES